MSNEVLSSYQPAQRWRKSNAEHIFPTASSWEWFKRKHSSQLVGSGQLIPGRGQRGDIVGPEIEQVVINILRSEVTK